MNLCAGNSSALGASNERTTYGTYIARPYRKTSRADDAVFGAVLGGMMFA